jgi:ankyrin repeat protein
MSRTLTSRSLTPQSNLEALRKEAKRLQRAVEAGSPDADARFRAVFPSHIRAVTLREAQQVLAREHGFESWAALKQEIADRTRSHEERVRLFLEKSVHRYGVDPGTQKWGHYERDGSARGAVAARLLARCPEIAHDGIHAAAAAHDVDAVCRFLAQDGRLARDRHPFDGWTPLLRLAFARLPIDAVAQNAVPIAAALLDAGADPNAAWSDSVNRFTSLTGVIGGGEAGQSPHPQAEALARLLIARGADPLDGQALYNTSLGADDTFWLDLLWTESERLGRTAQWREPVPELTGPPLDYLLGNAVPDHPKRTSWLLAHGADARAANAYSKQPVIKHAALAGQQEIVEILVNHGAPMPQLSDEEAFLAAATRGDLSAIRQLADGHVEYLRKPDAMFAAIRQDRADVAELLLNLGMSPDIGDDHGFRALHYTTHCGAVAVARLLLARGAEIDAFETRHGAPPLSHANYQQRPEMIALLVPVSRHFRGLCFAGAIDRVRELLLEEPDRANREDRRGEPALFCLPDDEERAVELAELLLSFGADPAFRNPLGQTPAEAARRRGLDDAADLLSGNGEA